MVQEVQHDLYTRGRNFSQAGNFSTNPNLKDGRSFRGSEVAKAKSDEGAMSTKELLGRASVNTSYPKVAKVPPGAYKPMVMDGYARLPLPDKPVAKETLPPTANPF